MFLGALSILAKGVLPFFSYTKHTKGGVTEMPIKPTHHGYIWIFFILYIAVYPFWRWWLRYGLYRAKQEKESIGEVLRVGSKALCTGCGYVYMCVFPVKTCSRLGLNRLWLPILQAVSWRRKMDFPSAPVLHLHSLEYSSFPHISNEWKGAAVGSEKEQSYHCPFPGDTEDLPTEPLEMTKTG